MTRVVTSVGADWSYDYDARGNLDGRYEGSTLTHDYTFDVEGRLASVRTNNQTTTFFYDADGQRVMTSRPDGVVVFTPFPDYEREVAADGTVTERTTYAIAGQMVAVQTKVGAAAGTYYYTYGDHLGSVVAMSNKAGGFISGSIARYDPFGNYRTWPGSNVNPLIFDRGFTGHVHDNTGAYPTQNVGLIYMNARYYLPEVGRFVSPDTIVPEPGNPQSYNRYSYSFNDPLNLTDPSGHRPTSGCGEYESGCSLDDELNPNQTYIDNNGSPVVADPTLLEKYPGDFTAEEAAWTAVGLLTVGAAPIIFEVGAGAVAAAWPALIGAGAQSVWRLNPFQRGIAIENAIDRSANLAQNYPVIDRFEKGVATSIKSIDLGAASYQNISTLSRVVEGYVTKLANWQGANWAGTQIQAADISVRRVIVAIPPGATSDQWAALQSVQKWATTTHKVIVTYITIR